MGMMIADESMMVEKCGTMVESGWELRTMMGEMRGNGWDWLMNKR